MALSGAKPQWLTFDCHGTLIQWDEGLVAAVEKILANRLNASIDPAALIEVYDSFEHELEAETPHRTFLEVAGTGLKMAMAKLQLSYSPADIQILTGSISKMPPFPEVVEALGDLKAQGFRLRIISNTDDGIIAGNVAQLNGHIDRVITAEQAQAYKPSRHIFEHAHKALGVGPREIVHVCASPHLDLAAARDMRFRCIWIDRGTGRKPLPDFTPDETFPSLDYVPRHFQKMDWQA